MSMQITDEFEDELLSEDAVEVSEEGAEEDLLAEEEPEDPNVYDDYGGGGGGEMPQSSYYGGGGAGGGGGGYTMPLPTPTPVSPPTVTPVTPVTPSATTPPPDALSPPIAVETPPKTPRAVKSFMDRAQRGAATKAGAARAVQEAKAAGMPAVAARIEKMSKQALIVPPRPGVSTKTVVTTGVVRAPALVTRSWAPTVTIQPRRLRGLEDLEECDMPMEINEISLADIGDEAEDFLYGGGNMYGGGGGGSFAPEGQIPGYEMDEYSGDYADDYGGQQEPDMQVYEPADYGPAYGPVPSQYGQQSPYGYQQSSPYGMDPYGGQYVDPYAMQQPYGYQQPYGQQPYGYSPYGQQPYGGCQVDPYTGQPTGIDPYTVQPCGQQQQQLPGDASSLFPPGTPQDIIIAATAIMNGTATLQQVQQAVAAATAMGYSAVANQLIAMYQQYGGQYTAPPKVGGGTRYCTAGQNPVTSGCIARPGTLPGGAVAGKVDFGPMPTDAPTCVSEAAKLLKTAQLKAALKVMQAKGTLTTEQKAYYSRYTMLKNCVASAGGQMPGGVRGAVMTDAQKAAGCQVITNRGNAYIKCPAPGQTIPTAKDKVAKGISKKSLGSMVYSMIVNAMQNRCAQDQGTPGKCSNKWAWNSMLDTWRKIAPKARLLPTDIVAGDKAKAAVAAAQKVVADLKSGSTTWASKSLNDAINAFDRAGIRVSA